MSNLDSLSFAATLHVRDHCLCLHAQRAARALARRFDAALRPHGLTNGQFSLLNALNRPAPPGMAPVAALYFGVGARLGLDRIRLLAARITASEHWDRLAIRRLVDDLFAAQRALSQALLAKLPGTATADQARQALEDWAASHAEALERTRGFLGALETTGELSIAKLTLANSQIHKLADI